MVVADKAEPMLCGLRKSTILENRKQQYSVVMAVMGGNKASLRDNCKKITEAESRG